MIPNEPPKLTRRRRTCDGTRPRESPTKAAAFLGRHACHTARKVRNKHVRGRVRNAKQAGGVAVGKSSPPTPTPTRAHAPRSAAAARRRRAPRAYDRRVLEAAPNRRALDGHAGTLGFFGEESVEALHPAWTAAARICRAIRDPKPSSWQRSGASKQRRGVSQLYARKKRPQSKKLRAHASM